MAEPRTSENLFVSEEFPRDAMLAFMLMHIPNPQADPEIFTPQLNQNIAQIIFEMVQVESARMREEVGLVSPRPSTTETPSAPKGPDRPPTLAVAQDPGQQLTTAIRRLFSGVPAVVPDA